ncbi:RHS repeat-associated core domain-containing protein [Chryseobacterium soli]|uniref:RHS repeat-associated core domain-containing protein n=1 Tax=Chryseobacterium soli TaxID=445961 RepID=UPI00068FED08|nr:RHS repeat-associated core domain-containing protein [Chryseobacterium soli]
MILVKSIEDDNWTKNYTYYDTKGRAVGGHSINHLGGYTRTKSQLDFAGVPLKTITRHKRLDTDTEKVITENFEYDLQNRLKKHYHQVDSQLQELLTENSYNELSQLKNKKVGNNLQSIDYAYNIRGWMTDINKDQMGVPDLGGKLFSYKIKYNQKQGIDNPDPIKFSGKNVTPKYNGNIAEVDWRAVTTLGDNPSLEPKRYGYAYDQLNRLSAGYYQNPGNPYSKENIESLTYDVNGNITNLYRTSVVQGTIATEIDDLEYFYTGNQATSIKDHSGNSTGYEGIAGNAIDYDANGNMKSMIDKQITGIGYNHLNLANAVAIGAGQVTTDIATKYRADGVKVRKENTNTSVGFSSTIWKKEVTDYLDGFQYLNVTSSGNNTGGSSESFLASSMETKHAFEREAFSKIGPPIIIDPGPIDPIIKNPHNPELQFFPTSEGYYDYQKKQYIYQYQDHLGNVRISFARDKNTGGLEITDANDYYPFGMSHLKTGNAYFGAGKYQNYKYNGKELQETGMYDYGARFYMQDIGRWGVVDPLTEKYRRMSPYTYVGNNPAMFVDYDGRDYGMYIDFKTGTVTIRATYYATGNDMKSANQAVKMWNGMSGKYNYTYKDANGNKVSMKVKFELQTSEVTVGKGEKRLDVLNKAMESATKGEGNIYRFAASKDMNSNENGVTSGGNSIRVKDSRADTETGAHEVGHSLGADHTSSGILTISSDDPNRSNDINSSNISDVMNAIVGTPSEPDKAKEATGGLGQATIHIENNNLQTDKDYKRFRNGGIQSAE